MPATSALLMVGLGVAAMPVLTMRRRVAETPKTASNEACVLHTGLASSAFWRLSKLDGGIDHPGDRERSDPCEGSKSSQVKVSL
jgi:hypothetical protein